MAKMKKFMVVHRAPELKWSDVERNWAALAEVEAALWERTWYNKKEGVRYCLWRAPNRETLERVFSDLDVTWESMLQVMETVPEVWRRETDESFFART